MIFPWSLLKQKEEKKTPVQKKQEEEKVVADESGVGGIKKQTRLELESTKGWKSRWMVFAGINSFIGFDFSTSNVTKEGIVAIPYFGLLSIESIF